MARKSKPPKKPVKKPTKKPVKKPTKKSPAKKKPVKFKLPAGAVPGGGHKPILSPLEAKAKMTSVLERAATRMMDAEETGALGLKTPLDVSVNTFKYTSGSVDGTLTIRAVPRGLKVHDLLVDLENVWGKGMGEAFFSVGLRYSTPEGIESADYRYRGLGVAQTYYHRAGERKLRWAFLSAREANKNIAKRHRGKPEQIFVKIHWNPKGQHPKRGKKH